MPADQTLPMLEADCGVATKDSKMMPQEESNIKMLQPPEPIGALAFHLDLPLHVAACWGPHGNAFKKENDTHGTIITSTS